MERDPFIRWQLPISYSSYERNQESIFNAWKHLPPHFRKQVWREREISANLYNLSKDFAHMPDLHSIGVGKRQYGEQRKLTGIILLDSSLKIDTIPVHAHYDIPQFIKVESEISGQDLEIPLKIEYSASTRRFGLVPAGRHMLSSHPLPLPPQTPTLCAGDVVSGENPVGFERSGTLSAIVSSIENYEPLLLSAAHVLGHNGWKVFADVPMRMEVGRVIKSDLILDAAIAELKEPWLIDYRMKNINIVPAAPIMPYSDMPVQYVGGASGHQTGWLDLVNSIPVNGSDLGIVPHFRASIQSMPGDSGALLLSGHGRDCPIPKGFKRLMHPAYLENMTCAMLGILSAGPSASSSSATRPQTYFSPILPILNRFKLQAWIRS